MKLIIESANNGYILTGPAEEGSPEETFVIEDQEHEYLKLKNGEHLDVTDAANIRRLLWEVQEKLGLFRGKHTSVRAKIILIDTEGRDVEDENYSTRKAEAD